MSEATGGEPRVGDRLPALSRTVTQDLMSDYSLTLGVGNPIHLDPEFAARTEFGGPIASGPIALALVDDTLATAYPGEWLRSGSIQVAFLKPVRPGDTVTARLTLVEVDPGEGRRTLGLEVECHNQDGTVVLAGVARLRLNS